MQTYEDLLIRLDEEKDTQLISSVYHNLGVVYAKLFYFEEAAEYFKKAYEYDGNENHMECMLSAYRMSLSDEKYLKLINSLDGAYEISSVVEKNIENTVSTLKQSDEYLRFKGLMQLKKDGNVEEFNLGMDSTLEYFKENYRNQLKR